MNKSLRFGSLVLAAGLVLFLFGSTSAFAQHGGGSHGGGGGGFHGGGGFGGGYHGGGGMPGGGYASGAYRDGAAGGDRASGGNTYRPSGGSAHRPSGSGGYSAGRAGNGAPESHASPAIVDGQWHSFSANRSGGTIISRPATSATFARPSLGSTANLNGQRGIEIFNGVGGREDLVGRRLGFNRVGRFGWDFGLGWGWGPWWSFGFADPCWYGWSQPLWYWDEPGCYGYWDYYPNYDDSYYGYYPDENYDNSGGGPISYPAPADNAAPYNQEAAPEGNAPSRESVPNNSITDLTKPTSVVLVYLKNGSEFDVSNYWVEGGMFHYMLTEGGEVAIKLDQLDLERTFEQNAKRGVFFNLNDSLDGASLTPLVSPKAPAGA